MVDRRQHNKKPNDQKQVDSRVKKPQKWEDYWYYLGSTLQS